MSFLLLLISLFGYVYTDYDCVCNYNVEKSVLSSPTAQAQPIGYLYEYDCKELVGNFSSSPTWAQVAFEHHIGYIKKDAQIASQVCPGDPPINDKVITPTTSKPTTSTFSSPQQSATTASTTSTLKRTTITLSTKSASTSTTPFTAIINASTSTSSLPTSTITSPTIVTTGHLQCPPTVLQTANTRGETRFVSQDSMKCYELVTIHKSWNDAETDCQSRGGHLATLTNSTEEQLMHHYVELYGHTTWIGLNDQSHEEHFEWSSGVPATYFNWYPERENIFTHNIEDCVAMGSLSGTWDDKDCLYNKYAYLCEYDAVIEHKGSTTNVDGNTQLCSSTVQHIAESDNGILGQFETGCYELIRSSYFSWQHSEDICQSRGGHLAHISSQQQQLFIQSFLSLHSPQHAVWIGLHDTRTEGVFEWTAGTSVSYKNWIPGHQSNFESFRTEDCVVIIPYKNGKWDDVPCDNNYDFGETRPILCQYNIPLPPGLIG